MYFWKQGGERKDKVEIRDRKEDEGWKMKSEG